MARGTNGGVYDAAVREHPEAAVGQVAWTAGLASATGRTNNGKYGDGNSRDGKAAEEAALADREAKTGIPIERQQVRATHPDVTKDGKPQWRYYDGLEPTDNPDEYIGIEAKTHPGAHQPAQDGFDGAVSKDSPAARNGWRC